VRLCQGLPLANKAKPQLNFEKTSCPNLRPPHETWANSNTIYCWLLLYIDIWDSADLSKCRTMPQDPNLYGRPPPKKQKKEVGVQGSLAFTSQLSSLLAAQSSGPSSSSTGASTHRNTLPARTRPSKSKTEELFNVKVKRKAKDGTANDTNNKLVLKETIGYEDEKAERAHARRRMEAKARLYAVMQRGDYVGREVGLVDFDRKWAESKDGADVDRSPSSSDLDSDPEEDPNIDTEIVEWEDEFGRLRRGTRAEKIRRERQVARGIASAAELERMSARPRAPENLIIGDAVQAEAFTARDEVAMEEMARKRDRSATPPIEHYRADKEIRTKGVGFYAFSRDEETRKAEMASLEAERARTDALQKEREEKVSARRREIEARRKELGERRAKKLADTFLEGLEKDILTEPAGGGIDDAES